jgi:SpoVK/Ycf46/Vps4 family AAA+-type ATPase
MGLNSSKGGAAATSLLGAFLAEMDGFEQRGNVIVIAATNRPWDMDPSLQRAGRFRPMLYLGLPDESSRAAIVRVVAAKLSVDEAGLDYDEVARETEGYSGADLGYILSTAYETNGMLNMQSIREAIADEEPSVDEEMREKFETWTATKKKKRLE